MNRDNPICQSYLEGLVIHVNQYSIQTEPVFRNYIKEMLSDPEVGQLFQTSLLWNTKALCITANNINAFKIYLEYLNEMDAAWMLVYYRCKEIAVLGCFDSLELLFRHPSHLEWFQGYFPYKSYITLESINPQITQIIDKLRMEYNLPPYTLIDDEEEKVCVNLFCSDSCCKKKLPIHNISSQSVFDATT